jgi:hypothetical protein
MRRGRIPLSSFPGPVCQVELLVRVCHVRIAEGKLDLAKRFGNMDSAKPSGKIDVTRHTIDFFLLSSEFYKWLPLRKALEHHERLK